MIVLTAKLNERDQQVCFGRIEKGERRGRGEGEGEGVGKGRRGGEERIR